MEDRFLILKKKLKLNSKIAIIVNCGNISKQYLNFGVSKFLKVYSYTSEFGA